MNNVFLKAKNIFIVAIKGTAMANLAVILKKMGKNVTGSDVSEEFITDEILRKNKINFTIGFDSNRIPKNTDLVIYSAAHQGINNPQVQEAQRRGIKIQSQAEVLRDLSKQFKTTIAICGCHGKTTTASLLSYALIKLGIEPSYLVGSSSFNGYDGGNYHTTVYGSYFVVEADEYGVNPPHDKTPKFLFLKPKYIICTNIDFDHPDVYKNIDETKQAFLRFFKNTIFDTIVAKMVPRLFLCVDDKNLMAVAKKLPRKSYITYGFSKSADFRITDWKTDKDGSKFKLSDSGQARMTFKISLFGEKNISNAAGIIALLHQFGFKTNKIKEAISGFSGAKRRFEQITYINDIFLFDDYAHHPNEIQATIEAARKRFPKRRIIIIFQPHTYSRTKALLKEFGRSLSLADKALILPIFPSARENPLDFNISSKNIINFGNKIKLKPFNSKNQLFKHLKLEISPGDVIFTMGAGDVYKLKDDIIKIISKLKCQSSNL